MSEVLEIEVDGEIDDDSSFDGDRRAPRWGLPLAIGVAGALLMAVLLVVVVPTVIGGGEPREPAPAAPASPGKLVALVKNAEGALAAWGRFAVGGDLRKLEGWFVPDGPQYRLLEREAARLSAHPPGPPAYDVSLSEPNVVSVTGARATLRGDVTWTRVGEMEQRYRWEVVLQQTPEGRWLLWTVTESN